MRLLQSIRILILFAIVTSLGCQLKNSYQDGYKYQNPESGKETSLRKAQPVRPLKQSSEKEIQTTDLNDATVQLDSANKTITAKVTRNLYDEKGGLRSSERIELRGPFNPDGPTKLRDVEADKLGSPRLLATAECAPDRLGQKCATLKLNVIYDSQGHFQQFHAIFPSLPRTATTPTKRDSDKDKSTQSVSTTGSATTVVSASPPLSGSTAQSPLIVQAQQVSEEQENPKEWQTVEEIPSKPEPVKTTPSANNNDESELDEGDDIEDPTANAVFGGSAITSSDWDEIGKIPNNPYVPVTKPLISKDRPQKQKSPAVPPRNSTTNIPAAHGSINKTPPRSSPSATPDPTPTSSNGGAPQTTSGLLLKLTGGGTSIRYHDDGYIQNTGTLFPTQVTGGVRSPTLERRAYGNGFSVDFMEQTTRRFTMANPECGTMNFMQISKAGGGDIGGHATHETGLDFDISYFGTPHTHYATDVRVRQKNSRTGRTRTTTIGRAQNQSSFPYQCFLKYMKFMYDQKFENVGSPNDGVEVVDLFWVNPAIQTNVCSYVKRNNLKDEYGDALLLMYPWSGHTSHFHVRLRCSPAHSKCITRDLDRNPPYQKRGCKNL